MKLLAERREQELRLVRLRRAPVLDPVQRAVNQFDDRERHGTRRQPECDGSDIQSADHGMSSARSIWLATITAPEMGTYSAWIIGASSFGSVGGIGRRAGLGQWRARMHSAPGLDWITIAGRCWFL